MAKVIMNKTIKEKHPARVPHGKPVDFAELTRKLQEEAVPPDRFGHRGTGICNYCKHCGRQFFTKSAMEAHRLAKHAGRRKSRAKAPRPIWSQDVLRMHPLGRARRFSRYRRWILANALRIPYDATGNSARSIMPAHIAEKGGVAR